MISLLVTLIIIGVVWYFVNRLPMESTIRTIVQVGFVLLAIFVILGAFGVGPGIGLPRFNT